MIKKLIRKIRRVLGIPQKYASETSKVRHLVVDYCKGLGCDIGFGGDKICKENCLGIDFQQPYAATGIDKVDIICDVMKEKIPVADNHFDYVYSSHLIEDFVNTENALTEFIRILKNEGNLILIFPDQQKYEATCKKTGQPLNMYHVHTEMGLQFMLAALQKINGISYDILYSDECSIDYNVILVLKIYKS